MTRSEELTAFYYHIGLSLTQWAWVEQALFWIFCSSLKLADGTGPYAAAFFGIENFRSKLQAVDRAFAVTFGQSEYAPVWKELHKRATNLSTKRNNLAHWVMEGYDEPEGRRVVLSSRHPQPPRKPVRRKRGELPKPRVAPADAIGVRQISLYGQQFFALYKALSNLFGRLEIDEPHWPADQEQVGHPKTLAQIRAGIYESLEPPPPAFASRLGGKWAELYRPPLID